MSFASRIRRLIGPRRPEPRASDSEDTRRVDVMGASGLSGSTGDSLQQALRLNEQAGTHLREGKWNEALSCAERAHRLHPSGWAAAANMATALRQLGRLEEALEAYNLALARNPLEPTLSIFKGDVLVELRRHGEAVSVLQHALETLPDGPVTAPALLAMAKALEETSRPREAIVYWRRLHRVRPDLSSIPVRIARLERGEGV